MNSHVIFQFKYTLSSIVFTKEKLAERCETNIKDMQSKYRTLVKD